VGKQVFKNNFLGVPAKKSGRAFRCNLFIGEKPQKRIFTSIPNAFKDKIDDIKITKQLIFAQRFLKWE